MSVFSARLDVCYLRHSVTFKEWEWRTGVVWPFSFRDQTLCFSDMLFLIHEFWPAHTHTRQCMKTSLRAEWNGKDVSLFSETIETAVMSTGGFLRENRSFRTWCHDPLKHALAGGHGKDGPWALLLRHSRRRTNNPESPCSQHSAVKISTAYFASTPLV